MLKLAGFVALITILLVLIAWAGLDARYLHTEQFDGDHSSLTTAARITIRTNLEFTITNQAGLGIGERNVFRPANLSNAAIWITKRFEELGFSNVSTSSVGFPVSTNYRFDAAQFLNHATNIVAEIKGTSRPEEIIVIGAHYDTIGFSKDWTGDNPQQFRMNHPGTPGANDNASGVAAMLEIARLLKPNTLPRTVRFVAFANEEPPFFQEKDAMGSYIYAQQCRARNEKIIMMISLDTVGVYSRRDHNLKRAWPQRWLLPILGLRECPDYVAFMSNWDAESGSRAVFWAEIFATNSPVAVRTVSLPFIAQLGKEIFAWSDDWSFTRESYPAFTVTDTAFYRSDRYHEWSDHADNLTEHDYQMLSGVVSGLANTIKIMSTTGDITPKPKWYAGLGWLLCGLTIIALVVFCVCGCSTVGKPMRFDPDPKSGPKPPPELAWYIEGQTANKQTYSCSFIEFDGRGDYIDFEQHTNAWKRAKQLAETNKVLLIFYCHGWKNNSQSGDVVEFNSFLGRLAASAAVHPYGYRVHGIYLSWRGNLFNPYVDTRSEFFRQTTDEFGGPIVSRQFHRGFSWTGVIPETLSYWSRRRAAEHKVSSVPIARSVYTIASVVKSMDKHRRSTTPAARKDEDDLMESSRVMVMGHSFGALALERALGPASISALTDHWPWFDSVDSSRELNPLPIDFALFVNSAAPAIYAKEMRDFLAAHQSALRHAGITSAPVFISITSKADLATRFIHPIGNLLAPFHPSLQRTYTNLLMTTKANQSSNKVHQSAFFNRTPGHHPLLVDRWIVSDPTQPLPPATDHDSILLSNLDYETTKPFEFYTSPIPGKAEAAGWKIITEPPADEISWTKQFNGLSPIRYTSSYWFLRCDAPLIKGHNDCWSKTTMELYAALYRMVEVERRQQLKKFKEMQLRAAEKK